MYQTKHIHYKSIFKGDNQNETIEYKVQGIVHIDKEDTHIQFQTKENIVHIIYNMNRITLKHNESQLVLSKDEDIWNQYQLPYGSVALKTKLIMFEAGKDKLKIKYELYDEMNLISTVYILVTMIPCVLQEEV